MTVTQGFHKHWPAWILEDEVLRVVVLPTLGGKIASLFHKHSGKEMLFQPVKGRYAAPEFAGRFLDYDTSGLDEMLPTIDRCLYPDGAYQGREMPDHGEVWSLPWEIMNREGSLETAVDLRRLPLRLTRTLALDGAGGLELRYRVENTGRDPVRYLWALHPLFVMEDGMKLLLPREEREIFTVHNLGPRETVHVLNGEGESKSLPFGCLEIDRYPRNECFKFYTGPVHRGISGLHYRKSGLVLFIEADPTENPYLGVWINRGDPGVKGEVNLALEPASGFFDALDEAARRGSAPLLAPGEDRQWSVRIRLVPEKEAELGLFF